jgi:predicted aldo/keto reductase-like oxidoreductase
MSIDKITRRQFIKGASALAAAAVLPHPAAGRSIPGVTLSATDRVQLGKTGLRLSRLGIGTGSNSGDVQRALGHGGFNRLIRHAFDRGITYIDTADGYRTHTWIREAIQGIPREKLFILTKMWGNPEKPFAELDRYRTELGVDAIDCLLIHCQVDSDWNESHKALMDALDEAKSKKVILAHGVSCHSLPALSRAAALDWVDVNLVRINPQGVNIDTPSAFWNDHSNASHVPAILEQVRIMRENGHGVIGMKLIGDGEFRKPEDRERSIRFAMQPGRLDAAVIGFKSTAEVDEAIGMINRALEPSG